MQNTGGARKTDPQEKANSIAEPEEDETHVKSLSYDNTSPNVMQIIPNPSGVIGEQVDRQLNCELVENLLQLQEQYTVDYSTKIGTMYEQLGHIQTDQQMPEFNNEKLDSI